MPNITTFRPVINDKTILKGICYINLQKTMSPYNYVRLFVTPGTSFEPPSLDITRQILMDLN